MSDPGFAADFGPFGDRIWLNCSHQGPIPRVSAAAAEAAIAMKLAPFQMVDRGLFQDVPRRLREALGRLINVPADDVILGNSTSYGLTLLARGLDWRAGDEVLLVEGDFPAAIFPWLVLERLGVSVRRLKPSGSALSVDDLARELRPPTRVFCTTWVHSFRGHALDVAPLVEACRANGTLFALNASQGMGARPFDAIASGVDMVTSCGFKYLCGPYGTGFSWIRPDLRDTLHPPKGYWLANLTADDLAGDFEAELRPDVGARAFDVSGTANFFNVMAWTASVEYLVSHGIDRIAAWDQTLVSRLVDGLREQGWTMVSPTDGPARTTLTVFHGASPDQTANAFATLRARGVFGSMRQGNVRLSPHLFNTTDDIDAALEALGGGRDHPPLPPEPRHRRPRLRRPALRGRRHARRSARIISRMSDVPALPGEDLVREGLADLAAGAETIPALLVSIGAPRLRELGYEIRAPFDAPEHRLYHRLAEADAAGAHGRYNAFIRRLVSFERARACAR